MEVNVFSIIFGSFFVALKFWDICELSITIQHQPNSAILSACISLGDAHCRVEERDLAFHRQERGSAFWWNIWKNTRNQIGIFLLAIYLSPQYPKPLPWFFKMFEAFYKSDPQEIEVQSSQMLRIRIFDALLMEMQATWCHMVPHGARMMKILTVMAMLVITGYIWDCTFDKWG